MSGEGIEITSASALRAYSSLYRKTSHGDDAAAAHREETHHRDIEQSESHYIEEHPRVEVESSTGSDADSDQAWQASRRRKKQFIVGAVVAAALVVLVTGLSAGLVTKNKKKKDNSDSVNTVIASAEATAPGEAWPTYSPSYYPTMQSYSNDED